MAKTKTGFAEGWGYRIEGNLPNWKGASVVYSKAYAYMAKHGADDLLIEALASGDEETIKANMLRLICN